MRSRLFQAFEQLRLGYRFACKKIGLSGYQVHQIYLPRQQLLYIPIPKNACTSVKHALYEIEFGRRFTPSFRDSHGYNDHHDYYKKRHNAFTSVRRLRAMQQATKFALVRDPVERLLSCYRNRVLDLKDLQTSAARLKQLGLPLEPDINAFILNLEDYRQANKLIEHHSRPQAHYLGGTIDYLDHLFPIEEMEDLLHMLQDFMPDLQLLRRKSGGTKVTLADVSPEALEAAIRLYQQDYELLQPIYTPQTLRQKYQELSS